VTDPPLFDPVGPEPGRPRGPSSVETSRATPVVLNGRETRSWGDVGARAVEALARISMVAGVLWLGIGLLPLAVVLLVSVRVRAKWSDGSPRGRKGARVRSRRGGATSTRSRSKT